MDISPCREPGGPTGTGHVTLHVDKDGTVVKASVDDPTFENTHVGWCIADRYRRLSKLPRPLYMGHPPQLTVRREETFEL